MTSKHRSNRSRNRGRAHAKLRNIEGVIQRRERKIRAEKYAERAEKTHRNVSGVKFQEYFYSTQEAIERTKKQRRKGFINPSDVV